MEVKCECNNKDHFQWNYISQLHCWIKLKFRAVPPNCFSLYSFLIPTFISRLLLRLAERRVSKINVEFYYERKQVAKETLQYKL